MEKIDGVDLSSAINRLSSQESEQQTRKELLDYLRNEQKLEEEQAKNSGINTWVLIGALALLIWQLSAIDRQGFTQASSLAFIRLTVLSELLFWCAVGVKNDPFDSALRFQQFDPWKERSPFLAIAYFAWDAFPLALYTWLFGYLTSATLFLGVGVASVLIAPILSRQGRTGRFPAPRFKPPQVSPHGANFFLMGLSAYQFWIDFPHLFENAKTLRTLEIQVVLLLFGIFWTSQFLLKRHATETSTGWARQLERHLLLGSMSTRQVVSQIEQRVLGPRLSTVVANFWIELAEVQERATKAVENVENVIAEFGSTSEDSESELSDGVAEPVRTANVALDEVKRLHEELLSFITKTISNQKRTVNRDSRVIAAIGAIQREHKAATAKTSSLVDRVLNSMQSIKN